MFQRKLQLYLCFGFISFCVSRKAVALFPEIINVASRSIITANATCGLNGQEYYCSQTDDPNKRGDDMCEVCDGRSADIGRRHPPENAIDSDIASWWQSPSMATGPEFQYVTLTLDLQEIYQIAYVIVKSANAPRPGNWILERSVDGRNFEAWRYFALNDIECMDTYGLPATAGHSQNITTAHPICTTFFSKLHPINSGGIHATLPSGDSSSQELQKFIEARYIRFRFQKMNSFSGNIDHMINDYDTLRRHYYSVKDINVGGRCACNGHAASCKIDETRQRCSCSHNTCGDWCDRCCPMFNQYKWQRATSQNAAVCGKCQCHNHATACRYDEQVEQKQHSINIFGNYMGGGVCNNCQHFTTGNNCEKCKRGFYRPQGTNLDDPHPCLPCLCEGLGTNGACVGDDTKVNLGRHPGTCLCKQGFSGPLCNKCSQGYLNYPTCDPCPCSRAGSVNKACTGECICKENVEGPGGCDTCVEGTFGLDEFYRKGCTECFCNHATDRCEAARLAVYLITQREYWRVTDLQQRRVVAAAQYESSISIAQEDMSKFQSYFWLAPKDYLGKKQTAYGQNLTIKAEWVTLRGDTSGKPTRCPDVIIEGERFRIAYGGSYYANTKSATLKIPLREDGWYHFPKDIGDIPIDLPLNEYQLRDVSRAEMMEVLSNIKSMMFRARYHTEQVESLLIDIILEYGREESGESIATLITSAVERCICPPGYKGLSCEACELGYRRVDNIVVGGECLKCACNGHVDHCDPFTGACGECKHNTAGGNCERCAPGYYGNPSLGTPDDCKPCFCPLGVSQNEFVPECVADNSHQGFKCICPTGYDGPRCQQCSDGFFGNPMIPGNPCRPCQCNGNVDPRARGNCNRLTGECLKCLGNTAGFHCERCRDNHYGDPQRGQCIKCGCHKHGSRSGSCKLATGQCQCKQFYAGLQCEKCEVGRGGITEGCPLCKCDPRGSVTNICDAVTGQCPCKPGVSGRHCNSCIANYFGDIFNGCQRCECDERGSLSETCDIITGKCQCRVNVVGRTCSSCRVGFWGLANGADCQKCDCDFSGTLGSQCDDQTGQCQCSPGVGGPRCGRCLPGYWGFSTSGCRACEPCGHPGRNCDLTTGKCVCPPNTEGDKCERCSQGFWDYSADIGCRSCRCSGPGSLERQCDPRTGRCVCRDGYKGVQCDKCSYGFFGYPHCRPCTCNRYGTDPHRCREEGTCQCDENGQCPCKPNVSGRACGKCVEGTFGLSAENTLGCFQCFCFKKSARCTQAELTWSQLALPGNRQLQLSNEETELNITNQLYVIPEAVGDVTIGTSLPFLAPLYWQLPRQFMRDKIHSYNGYLRFRVEIRGNKKSFPDQILQSYPLVSIQGNWQLVLEFYPKAISKDGRYEVRLNEDSWRLKNDPRKVTREQMMIALQNLQHILIRATHADDFTSASLSEVTFDVATEGTPVSSRKALGVERCFCPESYSGLSCQNPNIGFYRWYKENHIQSQIIIDLVGESKPCHCNGRADNCDQKSGICMNCRENTAGPHCEVCATGYYGNPNRARCRPCACPSRQQNFAETCQADPHSGYICHCRNGYTGNKCEKCANGYFGNPSELGGSCEPCKCDPNGSIGRGCDTEGNCRCKPGITGRDCSQCIPRHVVSEHGCISCEDGCVNVLLDDVESMINEVTAVRLEGRLGAPWPSVDKIRNYTNILSSQLDRYESRIGLTQSVLLRFRLDNKARILLRRAEKMKYNANENLPQTKDVKLRAKSIVSLLADLRIILKESISYLDHYGLDQIPKISTAAAVHEAQYILMEIKSRNFDEFDDEAQLELSRAKKLLDRVLLMQQSGQRVDRLSVGFEDMQNKVDDLLKAIRDSKRNLSQTKQLDKLLELKIRRILSNLREVAGLHLYTEDRNFNTTRLVDQASRNLKITRRNFILIETLMRDLRSGSAALSEFEAKLWQLNNEYKDTHVARAEDHALDLKAQAIKLEKLFNKTRDVADGPLKAAQAYQRIVDALMSAEQAAKDASKVATRAYDAAFPGNADESLVRTSKFAMDNSINLREKGDSLRFRVDTLATALTKQRRDLTNTKELVDDSKHRLNVVDYKLATQFSSEISRKAIVTRDDAADTDENAQGNLDFVEELRKNLTLINDYTSQISNLDSTLSKEIGDNINYVEGATIKGLRLSTNLRRVSNRIEIRESSLRVRIEALKKRITQTRQYASKIRVSLTTDENGICVRKYRPFLQPSTTSRLKIGYTINSKEKDALILYMGSANASDFMAVEMIDRRIHFSWDAGGGQQTLIHPLVLETNDPQASQDTKWYHITIHRIGNIGKLFVRPAYVKNSRNQLYKEGVTGVSPAGFSRMDLTPWDYTWIGGVPDGQLNYMGAKRFAGCLHYVDIDGEPLGLWNFTQSIGCGACNQGFELRIDGEDQTSLGFNGRGYFKGTINLRRPAKYYSVILSFKSLDEDALLFLAYNKQKNQYFSIGLEDGHISFHVKFSEKARLVMKSEKKLNNMEGMIQIQAIVQIALKGGKRIGRLVVGDQDQLGTIKGGPDLDLVNEPFYFGGVDPEFNRDGIGKEIELRSLLGCMGGLSVMETGKNPLTHGQSYGIDNTCTNIPHTDVGFLGQGYFEMPSRVLRRDSNFGFTFKTMQSDALLMISTFYGQPLRKGVPNPPDFYSVSLVEGHLDLRLYAGSQRHRLMSKHTFNDGKLHSFFVTKENRKVKLFVNDQIINSTRLDRGSGTIEAPEFGGLFFGGAPPEVRVGIKRMVGSTIALKGCIQDVIINNKVEPFNKPENFENAFIGRCADLPRNAMGGMEGDMKMPNTCLPPKQHTVEYGALKFGDQHESHVLVPLDDKTFKTDFKVLFEFRTFYPNGLFFIAFNQKRSRRDKLKVHFFSAQLLNGRLHITFKYNKKEKKIISPMAGLNSGEWRKIMIEKKRRKLSVFVDGELINKEKIKKKNNFGRRLFIGNLPSAVANLSSISIQEPFRGCLRNLKINENKYDIPSLKRKDYMKGVGQCFATVQPGSYFPGDAYAIYDDNFQVGPLLELRVEFRTWELNGVLLSFANEEANVALSLELVNGAVILSVDIGHKHAFSAQVSLHNRYTLCDNQWHTVKAHYIKDSLTLKVDSHPESYGFNGSTELRKILAEAQLFVGGLPDSAPSGTLMHRESFKGCIRNIVLNNERKDWTDMYKLHNVLLNACPAII